MVDTLNVWDEPVTTRWKSCEVPFGFNGQMFVIPNHLLEHDAAYGVHRLLAGLPIHQACECHNTVYNLWLYIPVITTFSKKNDTIYSKWILLIRFCTQPVSYWTRSHGKYSHLKAAWYLGWLWSFFIGPTLPLPLHALVTASPVNTYRLKNWSPVTISKRFGHFTDVDDMAMLSSSCIQEYGERNAVGMM